MKKPKAPSYARLSPLAKGRIVGLGEAGTRRDDIAKMVKKKDGSSPSLITVDTVLQQFEADPQWSGVEDRTAGGRPQDGTTVQAAKIKKILLRDVGKFVVSATHVKRNLTELRRVPDRTIQRTFHSLGYSYFYRRARRQLVTRTNQLGLSIVIGCSSKIRPS